MDNERDAAGVAPDMEQLGARILRPDKRLSCEDLIAFELGQAVTSTPLQKIRHSCEAVMLLGPHERQQAKFTEKDVETAKMLHELALDLTNLYVHSLRDRYGDVKDDYANIPWSFPRKDAEKWLCWIGDVEAIYWIEAWDKEEHDKAVKEFDNLPRFERAFVMSKGKCTVSSARAFVSRFEAYGMPIAIEFMKKTITLVSPDSYRAALAIIRGGKSGKTSQA